MITNSSLKDVDKILELYDMAIAYQKEKGAVPWPKISKELVTQEILNNQQWKLTINDEIVCVWMTVFNDPLIWREKDNDEALYIHRIASNISFRGQKLVSKTFEWAKRYANANGKEYIRLDTVGENEGLINLYKKNGFEFLGLIHIGYEKALPSHYHNAEVCLFEMKFKETTLESVAINWFKEFKIDDAEGWSKIK